MAISSKSCSDMAQMSTLEPKAYSCRQSKRKILECFGFTSRTEQTATFPILRLIQAIALDAILPSLNRIRLSRPHFWRDTNQQRSSRCCSTMAQGWASLPITRKLSFTSSSHVQGHRFCGRFSKCLGLISTLETKWVERYSWPL